MKHYTPDIPKLRIYFSADPEFAKNCYAVKKTVREAVRATLYYEKFDLDTEISVTFCTNETIRALNREHRERDSATDVLSFPMYTAEEIAEIIPEEEEETVVLGDVVLSLERAKEQAEELGHGFLREVAFLTIHSVLHLLGYDHELSPEEDERQCARQKLILEELDLDPTL
ncbi:MAG: rRNA maturation RNase YbeY [Clostridia bacterium]|nr:rRNA maturation RNase YbeY [Clostridia bacterium]